MWKWIQLKQKGTVAFYLHIITIIWSKGRDIILINRIQRLDPEKKGLDEDSCVEKIGFVVWMLCWWNFFQIPKSTPESTHGDPKKSLIKIIFFNYGNWGLAQKQLSVKIIDPNFLIIKFIYSSGIKNSRMLRHRTKCFLFLHPLSNCVIFGV